MQPRMDEQRCKEAITNLSHEFYLKLKLIEQKNRGNNCKATEEFPEEEAAEDDDDFSFSRGFQGMNMRKISADGSYFKPVFPFFNQDLLLANSTEVKESLKMSGHGHPPNVNKVFVEMPHRDNDGLSGKDGIITPICKLGGKTGKDAFVRNNQNNWTDFSKMLKFKHLMHRGKRDGKSDKAARIAKKKVLPENSVKVKNVVEGKSSPFSAHDNYVWSRTTDDDRRRVYLARRQNVVGTNIAGAKSSRNVYPF